MNPISSSIPQFIADREGLAGAARTWFLEIMRREFRYMEPVAEARRRRVTVPAMLASAASLAGVALAGGGFSGEDGTAWLGCAWLATAVHWLAMRKTTVTVDRDAEWRAYCVLVRPLILTRYPALLDRNRRDTEYSWAVKPFSMAQSFRVSAKHARRELATAALVGLWIGASAYGVIHSWCRLEWTALSLLPAVSAIAAPLLWALWRWCALRTMLQDVED
ncbi:MAG: hypothetical protein KF715_19670 [Candidatus Didemnitutus sp.]|nr:hypothetical protein [Candidatus Didemnitutus sp.]